MSLSELKRRIAAHKSAFIEPCLQSLAKAAGRTQWIHEMKYDGYRLQARRDADGVHLLTRNNYDFTSRYPTISADVKALRCRSCIIDGEVVVIDDTGLAVFDKLRYGARDKPEAMLYAFDLLELDGAELRRHPIEERKTALAKLLGRKRKAIRLVDHLELGDGALIFEHACAARVRGHRFEAKR